MSKRWSKEEESFLESKWGVLTVHAIAKQLNKTYDSITTKAYRMGLNGAYNTNSFLTIPDITQILNTDRKTVKHNIENRELKAVKKRFKKRIIYSIKYEDFITWLVNNTNHWNSLKADLSMLETLGLDNDFIKAKYKSDMERKDKTTLTNIEIARLKHLYKLGYKLDEIATELNKTTNTITWQLTKMSKNKEFERTRNLSNGIRRKYNRNNYGWTLEQDTQLLQLQREGMKLKEIAVIVGKSLSATKTRNQVLFRKLMKGEEIC